MSDMQGSKKGTVKTNPSSKFMSLHSFKFFALPPIVMWT